MNTTNTTTDVDQLIMSLVHAVHDYVPSQAQYIILLIIMPLAVACNLFILYHLLTDKNLRKELHNHVIIAILFSSLQFNLIHAPFSINLFRTGSVWPRSIIACSIWRFTAYTGCNANDVFLAWAAIERHILIYHSNLMKQPRYQILFHYVPLALLLVYLIGFNAACFLTPTCFTSYNFNVVFCDASCLNAVPFMATWYLMVNQLVAAIIAIVFSLALWLRVIYQRKRAKGTVEWRRLNKLTTQVLVITVLFIVLEMPYAITCTINYLKNMNESIIFGYGNSISLFLCYIMPIIMPFACLLGLHKELWPRLMKPINHLLKRNEKEKSSVVATEQLSITKK
ncbi:unnamed protein product [Adineta steineri]|uniref:G-protein coupled receptors family 1 profile domain-containing protein n=2 Tax=Adineta steineri TaxID=433720 RepID=A0A819SY62_9BILA|nr:unnamed protein product [Adineta steineri]